MSESFSSLQDKSLRSVLLTDEVPDKPGRWVAQKVESNQVYFSPVNKNEVSVIQAWLISIRVMSLTETLMPALAVLLWLDFRV